MDKPISKKPNKKRFLKIISVACVSLLSAGIYGYVDTTSMSGKTFNVDTNNLVISSAQNQRFEEYLPLRGIVEPQDTIFIDAIDGGRVEEVYILEGAQVAEGDAILKLSNTSLQLSVLAREAEVSEQINNMRNTRLALEQNQLALKRDVIELDFEVQRLEKELARSKTLVEQKLLSQRAYEQLEDELAFQLKYRETVNQSQQKEALLQEQQLQQLAQSIKTLESNLAISRASLDKLVIRAPQNGQLTFLDAKVGESKQNGQRLGQVDLIDNYKISAQVDEFYVSKVSKGQTATFQLGSKTYETLVNKVYPGIDNGTFKVDFSLQDPQALSQLRLGQSVQLKFHLSSSQSSLQIKSGGFMQSTAGSWVFVIDPSGQTASKRAIRVGRKNPQSIEILSGLQPGEKVITSSYSSFPDAEFLKLSKQS